MNTQRLNEVIDAGRVKVRKFCGPFSLYIIEHFSNCMEMRYSRVVLNALREGGYEAKKLVVNLHYMSPFVQESTLGRFKHKHLAMNCIEQEVTCLEQEGFTFVNEYKKDQFDLKAAVAALREIRMTCFSLKEFVIRNQNPEALVQMVDRGMHMMLLVDEWGKTWYRPVGYAENMKWTDASNSHIEAVLEGLATIDGSQGFVGEGFFDGCHLTITDVSFVKNTWMHELCPQQRLNEFEQMLAPTGIVKPTIAQYQRVKAADVTRLCSLNKSLIVSVPKATSSLTAETGGKIYRALVSEHEPFVALFGQRKTHDHSEIYDYSDLKSKGLAFHNLKVDLNGLTFTTCNFRPGDKSCALFC